MPARLLNRAVEPVPSTNPGLPALPASVETVDEAGPGGVTALTVNASTPVMISLPVVVVIVRGPSAAVGEIVICAVALVEPVTLNESTVISPPNEAVVCPGIQFVPVPVSVTPKVCPCVPLDGDAASEA
ncbi:MAG: hypothetical protein JMDDDDMK_00457 [Acidobacteria bacterium]|nr:hypothetical protein [Acidobacteriota bacterium]